ncbi:Vegetative incompatibility protein HET-E-1 [Pseudocercospora fuligena]|uniref:Vegetative incompatibility protein HET-E-1 n=1 Tax=Pseudocercospora fuligena TaxID=685502 RepID=A0A8H6VRQ6_9PEZI|nr:Vegetative incompatibility protein HET-E-1 [Pseudocercospora fuligena]
MHSSFCEAVHLTLRPRIRLVRVRSASSHQNMRLINIWTLELAEFVDPPPYAILSHRWEAGEIKHEEYSEWFTRGWTLQELPAPEVIIFCDADWRHFGIKTIGSDMHDQFLELISSASSIPVVYLQGYAPSSSASVAQRMSWASNRVTTRPEDTAYCLFGLFDINLPLLYGEGHAAFQRLQEEIIRTSDDETIFAWRQPRHEDHGHSVLAYSPARFADSGFMQRYFFFPREPYTVTHKGIQIKAELLQLKSELLVFEESEYYLPLNCIEVGKEELLENIVYLGNRPLNVQSLKPEPYIYNIGRLSPERRSIHVMWPCHMATRSLVMTAAAVGI